MADFNTGINPIPTQGAPQITNPIDTTTASGISAFAGVAGAALGAFLGGRQAAADKKLKEGISQRVESFRQNLLKKDYLVASGQWDADKAGLSMRVMYAKVFANATNDDERKQLQQAWDDVTGSEGLAGTTLAMNKEARQNENSLKLEAQKSAMKDGYILPSMSDDQKDLGVKAWQQVQFGKSQMEAAGRVLDLQSKEVGLTNAKLETQLKRQSYATGALTQQRLRLGIEEDLDKRTFRIGSAQYQQGVASATGNAVSHIIESIGKPRENGQQYTPADAVSDLEQLKISVSSEVASTGTRYASQSQAEILNKPVMDGIQLAIDRVNGKLDAETYEQKTKALVAYQGILTASDPQIARAAAIDKLLPSIAPSFGVATANAVIPIMQKNGTLDKDGNFSSSPADLRVTPPSMANSRPSADVEKDEAVKDYFQGLRENAAKAAAGGLTPEATQQYAQQVVGILSSAGKFATVTDNPAELNEYIKYLADPGVGQFLAKHPEVIKGQAANRAEQAFRQFYTGQVRDLIMDQLEDASVTVGVERKFNPMNPRAGSAPVAVTDKATSQIRLTTDGVNAYFEKINPSAGGNVGQQVDKLNKELAPIINREIRAMSHLTGSLDYKKGFEAFMSMEGSSE